MNKYWFVILVLISPLSFSAIYIYENNNGKQIVTNLQSNNKSLKLVYSSNPNIQPQLGLSQKIPDLNFDKKLFDWINQSAKKHNVSSALIYAVIRQESNFKQNATSSKGAMGLMQLMPKTAQSYGLFDIYDPKKNIDIGTKHLKRLLIKYKNDLDLVLAAYNAGEGNVKKYKGIPPFAETKIYVKKVNNFYLIAKKNNSLL
ncbi:MAG: lytic transglycosylase domain-containing protein [Saccharospirillaceae bacterium]|nr:lytic transglycosylase domain-containing protein [Pseudomonadales bacterium]NRB80301.1 lytic transglycosylase domain-containing protein [Saccharospirillaceae bacterium]